MFRQSPLSSRNQFGTFLKDLGLTGRAVEIGSHRGDYAAILLRSWPGHLTCVDPWTVPDGYEDQAKLLWGGEDRDGDHRVCLEVMSQFPGRSTAIQGTSQDAALVTPDNSIDFVYIDGDHRWEFVLKDLQMWWDKLKVGGILAGHDWLQPGESHSWAGNVQEALEWFLDDLLSPTTGESPDVFLIVEEGGLPWSFYLEKT